MHPDDQEAADLLRRGTYYEQARKWYQVLYVGPVAERSFFLVIAGFAAVVGLASFFAFMGLMPLTERPGILISNPRLDDTAPNVIRLRAGSETINDALRRYYVVQYVLSRESYDAASFEKNVRFVSAYSAPPVTEAYAAVVGQQNPRNPAALLGAYGKRQVNVTGVNIVGRGDTQSATVKFSTDLIGVGNSTRTQWTATLQFHYSEAVTTNVTDPETGAETVSLQEPTFQVVNYALTQN